MSLILIIYIEGGLMVSSSIKRNILALGAYILWDFTHILAFLMK